MLKVYLVQDRTLKKEMSLIESQTKQIEILGSTTDVEMAFWDIAELGPNAVFVDMDHVGDIGIELAKRINKLHTPPSIIFKAETDRYVQDALELGVFDYIVKPLEEKRLKQIIEKFIYANDQTLFKAPTPRSPHYEETIVRNKYTDKFIIKLDDRIKVINTDEIVYIGTENRQVFVKTLEGKYTVDTPLYVMEKKLGPSFIRIHRSFIVNIYYIVEIQPWFSGSYTLLFKDGSNTPVSRSHIKDVRRILEF